MTVKQLFPNLSKKHRAWLGRRLASSFFCIYNVKATKIIEDGEEVNDYPEFFRKHVQRIYNRFVKKIPVGDPQAPVKKKRARIKKVEQVRPLQKPKI